MPMAALSYGLLLADVAGASVGVPDWPLTFLQVVTQGPLLLPSCGSFIPQGLEAFPRVQRMVMYGKDLLPFKTP